MSVQEDLVLIGPDFQQVNAGKVKVLPTGGTTTKLADLLQGFSNSGSSFNVGTLSIGGTIVTSTAGEINQLHGATVTAAELTTLHGVVAGTASASKALVLGASKNIDTMQFGTVVCTGLIQRSAADALTATGSNQATGLALTAEYNNITTAALSTGVVLPVAVAGERVVVFNNGANPIKVYGNGTDTIDGTAGATGVTLTNALRCDFVSFTNGKWLSAKEGAVSS